VSASKRVRLDVLCVERGLAPSRQRAQGLILAGQVLVEGAPVTKAGTQVLRSAAVALCEPDHPYVSRGGLKLEAALDTFALDVRGLVALDVGASTGGFTDCLLQRGARHVIAVDVGYGQLDWKLRSDARVSCVERMNARKLEAATLREAARRARQQQPCRPPGAAPGTETSGEPEPWPPELATIDVSFISLTLVLPAVAAILGPNRPVVALIKPQFEAGKEQVGKGGVVRDPLVRAAAIQRVTDFAQAEGFRIPGSVASPVPGPKGNVEELALLLT
jgi:23S rRNA (cytidine1920-2'-O)/16S rRNA (cytidine1409-2'-O)-methyltransferase